MYHTPVILTIDVFVEMKLDHYELESFVELTFRDSARGILEPGFYQT